MSEFKNHFSTHTQEYAHYRPHYPEVLFSYLSSLCAAHHLAWDCATGNGQAAVSLAKYFDNVITKYRRRTNCECRKKI